MNTAIAVKKFEQFYPDDGHFIVLPKTWSFIATFNKDIQNASAIELLY